MAKAKSTAKKSSQKTRLDHNRRSKTVSRFENDLIARVVGQEKPLQEIVQSFVRLTSGIRNPDRPILTLLFLGPTGVGKTETVKVLANTIFGSNRAFTRVNCQEFSSPHQVAKLLGAPPGYVGGDIEPILSQDNIDSHHKRAFEEKTGMFRRGSGSIEKIFPEDSEDYLSIVLFDEVEKADPVMWNSLLGILDDGHLTLGNNKQVDFTRSIIVLTSNVGSFEMSKMLTGKMGFGASEIKRDDALEKDLNKEAVKAAKEVFPFEFLNRFDSIVVYESLTHKNLYQILDIYIDDLHRRVMETDVPFLLELSNPVRKFLVDQGYDPQFGARPLRRVVEKHVVTPLSNLLSTGQVKKGDFITTRLKTGEVIFEKDVRQPKTLVTTRR